MFSCSWWRGQDFRNDIPKHILRYSSDIDVENPEQMEKVERELWDHVHDIDADTKAERWIPDNCRRFQGRTR